MLFDENIAVRDIAAEALFRKQVRELANIALGKLAIIVNERDTLSFNKYSIEKRKQFKNDVKFIKSRLTSPEKVFTDTFLEGMFKEYWDKTLSSITLESVLQYKEDIKEVALHGALESNHKMIERVFSIVATFALEENEYRRKKITYEVFDDASSEKVAIEKCYAETGLNIDTAKRFELYLGRALESDEAEEVVANTLDDVQKDVNKASEKSALIKNVARFQNETREKVEKEFKDKFEKGEGEDDEAGADGAEGAPDGAPAEGAPADAGMGGDTPPAEGEPSGDEAGGKTPPADDSGGGEKPEPQAEEKPPKEAAPPPTEKKPEESK